MLFQKVFILMCPTRCLYVYLKGAAIYVLPDIPTRVGGTKEKTRQIAVKENRMKNCHVARIFRRMHALHLEYNSKACVVVCRNLHSSSLYLRCLLYTSDAADE